MNVGLRNQTCCGCNIRRALPGISSASYVERGFISHLLHLPPYFRAAFFCPFQAVNDLKPATAGGWANISVDTLPPSALLSNKNHSYYWSSVVDKAIRLNQLNVGQKGRLQAIEGDHRLIRRLLGLGIRVGAHLVVTQRRGGSVVVASQGARVAIGPGLADRLRMVLEEVEC